MNHLPRWLLIGLVLGGIQQADAGPPDPLKILYAGNPGSDRERDYVGFLRESFRQVDAVDYRAFRPEQADGHDVVIFDWTSIYPRDAAGRVDMTNWDGRMNYPKPTPELPATYARPTILIGGNGERVVRPLRLKIDWGCLCLHDHAHGMKTEHPIFRTPFPVDLQLEVISTPVEYDLAAVGPTIQAWRVQTPRFFDADPGLVARGNEFEEAPDAEVISSGTNGKTPRMVALGRQGNYFLWGFASPPSEMTPSARTCFRNVVHYIKQFDGQAPVVHKPEEGTVTRPRIQSLTELAPKVLDPDGLRKSNPAYADYTPEKYEQIRTMELRILRKHFPAEVNEQASTNPHAYRDWYEANQRWLIPGGYDEDDGIRAIAADPDLKALGLPNHDVATLDACVALLARSDQAERALRVLQRYTGQDFTAASAWQGWLDAHRDRLVFTEIGGFRFVIAPSAGAARPDAREVLPLAPPGPTRKLFDPVQVTGSVEPAQARPGEVVTIMLRIEVAAHWHITAAQGPAGPQYPLNLRLALPAGLESVGEWAMPAPTFDPAGHGQYEDSTEFRHQVRITQAVPPGPIKVGVTAGYQACDPNSCRPPAAPTVAMALEVLPP